MGKDNKKLVEAITARDDDFAQWYTDIVKKADLAAYSSQKGFVILRPYGYAIWERIQAILDAEFKKTGHENVYMPMLIPESLLNKEKDHIAGFAPEVAWVTHGGDEKLTEKLCIRPTSETLFCEHYRDIIHSHRDLPKLYNQWCSVVRWEKTTRPFLRTREFLWQEGHTAHASAEEADGEAIKILDIYTEFCEKSLALPVIKGRKTESDKFAGAVATYAIEALMHDGKALQSGTTHFFGDGFARAFGIQYQSKDNTPEYVWQSSWGVTTRLIGGIIMTHGDDSGLVLPPDIAPIQAVIIPIQQNKDGVLTNARALRDKLVQRGLRVKLDDSDNSPGWKFAEYEMKGVPLRLEIGPKDIETGQFVAVRRDNREKTLISLTEPFKAVEDLLETFREAIYKIALDNRKARSGDAGTIEEISALLQKNGDGFVRAMWCGDEACEKQVKERTGAGSRCIPFEQERIANTCVCCGKPADTLVLWAKAY